MTTDETPIKTVPKLPAVARLLTVIRGGRDPAALPRHATLREAAPYGPQSLDMVLMLEQMEKDAAAERAAAEASATRLRLLSDGSPIELDLIRTTVRLRQRFATLLTRRVNALRELLGYMDAIPPREAEKFRLVLTSILDRQDIVMKRIKENLEARNRGAAPRSFADTADMLLDRIEALNMDLAELEGALATCRSHFGGMPAPRWIKPPSAASAEASQSADRPADAAGSSRQLENEGRREPSR
ncbi:MAG: hypothetical protein RMK97_00630 [Sutterellaceae bacterium]|nr:hypothetical protein [Burkholderiaceae bacterium]MDW8429005.1 hypothetical protein [Sutterellaceae bacterium]